MHTTPAAFDPAPAATDQGQTVWACVLAAFFAGLAGFAAAIGLVAALSAPPAAPGAGTDGREPSPQERRLEDQTPGRPPEFRYAAHDAGALDGETLPQARS